MLPLGINSILLSVVAIFVRMRVISLTVPLIPEMVTKSPTTNGLENKMITPEKMLVMIFWNASDNAKETTDTNATKDVVSTPSESAIMMSASTQRKSFKAFLIKPVIP